MEFIADLHLHSHFSRATAKNLDLEHTCQAAMLKGITVVGTGDFTHPGWFKELEDKLEPAEQGLFKLKQEIEDNISHNGISSGTIQDGILHNCVPELCRKSVRFILQCEISSIYKKDGRVRKNHNLIYFPDMASVRVFNDKLGKIGNITSDGRPILGLDCEKLLEIMLETSDDGFMIPAHIWTPWFSMFGSKSGFDSVEECFGSLIRHIFAVETGLSSDLPMNWRVENLDRMSFISCSDAHSPMFMGRNASVFNTDLSYKSIRDSLKQSDNNKNICDQNFNIQNSQTRNSNQIHTSFIKNLNPENSYSETIDMYPEEGKYHYDGHRKCNVCFNPAETLRHKGICPECGKPLTLGVLYRVQELASRPEGYIPKNRHGYQSIIPLAEILAEICETGTGTKKVDAFYTRAISTLGPELDILLKKDIGEIELAGIPLLSEAIRRMRNREIHLIPGYDGEFGRVTVFTHEEKEGLKGDISMFRSHPVSKENKQVLKQEDKTEVKTISKKDKKAPEIKIIKIEKDVICKTASSLNLEQQQAMVSINRPLLMEAGPGTGKTHTLTEKIASLITNDHVAPQSILALTFTIKAAEEMRQRIEKLTGKNAADKSSPENRQQVFISTFHGFCLMVLKEYTDFQFSIADETLRKAFIEQAIKLAFPDNKKSYRTTSDNAGKKISLTRMELDISMLKQGAVASYELGEYDIANKVVEKYQELLSSYQLVDFEDLMVMVLDLLKKDSGNGGIRSELTDRFAYIFVDEYQDINRSQYELIRLMAGDGKKLCVIGDPDQSIYGFRGADNKYFQRFAQDYPDTEKIVFKRNYRSTEAILEASFQLIAGKNDNYGKSTIQVGYSLQRQSNQPKEKLFSGIQGEQQIHILQAASEEAQAVMIGKTIERLVGGISMFSMDAGKVDPATKDEYSFSDIAVLYRTKKQSEVLSRVFEKAGIPFQTADRDNIFLQKGIKELISCLRILTGRGTFYDFDVLSVNKKAVNSKVLEFCSNSPIDKQSVNSRYVKGKSTSEILRQVMVELEIEKIISKSKKSMETAERLMKEAEKYPDPALFYEHVAMKKDIDSVEYKAEKVQLMTMHASKGLEFKVIFIAGCENGLIPFCNYTGFNHSQVNESCGKLYSGKCENIDEERRLFYVAMTRAEELLYLCYGKKRQIYGKTFEVERSPFLNDIEDRLKRYSKSRFKRADKSDCDEQLEMF